MNLSMVMTAQPQHVEPMCLVIPVVVMALDEARTLIRQVRTWAARHLSKSSRSVQGFSGLGLVQVGIAIRSLAGATLVALFIALQRFFSLISCPVFFTYLLTTIRARVGIAVGRFFSLYLWSVTIGTASGEALWGFIEFTCPGSNTGLRLPLSSVRSTNRGLLVARDPGLGAHAAARRQPISFCLVAVKRGVVLVGFACRAVFHNLACSTSDPGEGFPIDWYLDRVRAESNPG